MINFNSLTNLDLDKLYLSSIIKHINLKEYQSYINAPSGQEHYRLLAWASLCYENSNIFDIGTYYGCSSIALSYNINNKVISYDITDNKKLISYPNNCIYKIGDFRQDNEILSSPLILIDVDPHDGVQEEIFHRFFINNNYKGLVIWDDIHLSKDMNMWWYSIKETDSIHKIDLTHLGHWSGTGAIIYA